MRESEGRGEFFRFILLENFFGCVLLTRGWWSLQLRRAEMMKKDILELFQLATEDDKDEKREEGRKESLI